MFGRKKKNDVPGQPTGPPVPSDAELSEGEPQDQPETIMLRNSYPEVTMPEDPKPDHKQMLTDLIASTKAKLGELYGRVGAARSAPDDSKLRGILAHVQEIIDHVSGGNT